MISGKGRRRNEENQLVVCDNKDLDKLGMKEYTDYEIFWEFQRRLIETYKREHLKCISGLDNSYTINGENVLSSFTNAMRKGQRIYEPVHKEEKLKFDYNRLNSDLELISNEILHFSGLTCFYSNYINNPLDNPITLDGEIIYGHFKDLPDPRFFTYATCAYEKLYNYWDRIGDLIASFFPEIIKPEKVYFSRLDKFIPTAIQDNESINWLIDFKNSKFLELNNLRIRVVHYENLDTTFSSEHSYEASNRNQLEKLVNKRSNIIPNLKEHIDLTLEGFQKTIRFMEFLNDQILTDDVIEEKRKAVHNNN